MIPIKITARLCAGLSVWDDYSPDLASILEYQWLDQRNLLQANPSPKTAITPDLPIARHTLGDDWLWAISAPSYQYVADHWEKARKRWDADQIYPVNWQGKRANVQTDGGRFKSHDKPVPVRLTGQIDWYAVGEPMEVESLLKNCTSIGHRRHIGYGQVWDWVVQPVEHDWSLLNDGRLMAPLPCRIATYADGFVLQNVDTVHWNVKAPRWDKSQAELCFMPKGLVKQEPPVDWFQEMCNL